MNLLNATLSRIVPQDAAWRTQARQRLDQLIMPHWALGRLMDLALDLAGMTRSLRPAVARKTIITMAGDHGVAGEGVSKYPQEVTAQMVHGFVAGLAGINVLARLAGARVVVVDMGVVGDLSSLVQTSRILDRKIAPGTGNIALGPAMTRDQAVRAVEAGIEIVEGLTDQTDVFGTGDMGIANTTPSTAIAAVLTGRPVAELVGRGTGIDDAQLGRKITVVERALERAIGPTRAMPWTSSPASADSRLAAWREWSSARQRRENRSSLMVSLPRPGPCWPRSFVQRRRIMSLPPIAVSSRGIGSCTSAWEKSPCWIWGSGWGREPVPPWP